MERIPYEALNKEKILYLIRIFHAFLDDTNPKKKYPEIFPVGWEVSSLVTLIGGVFLHLLLWCLGRCALKCRLYALAIWTARKRITYDYLWFAPQSCGLNHAYTDLGIACFRSGKTKDAVECLQKSWKVFPCPHNTSFGLSTRLCQLLAGEAIAADAVQEYREMRDAFKGKRVFI